MKSTKLFPRDYSDPLEVALLLCKAADLRPNQRRDAIASTVAAYIEDHASVGGDYSRLALLWRLLSPELSMPDKNFEAALHLHVRACAGRSPSLAPEHLRKLSEDQIVTYVLTLHLPPKFPRPRAKKKSGTRKR
jgi:hypothetical protein